MVAIPCKFQRHEWGPSQLDGSQSADMFRQRLDELVNLNHPLAQLATHIDWNVFEREWAGHFPSSRGRPATSTRLIAGLLYLQHTFALSEVIEWTPPFRNGI